MSNEPNVPFLSPLSTPRQPLGRTRGTLVRATTRPEPAPGSTRGERTLLVPLADGTTRAVRICDVKRGLAVQPAMQAHDLSPGWGVVHVATGQLVVHCVLPTRQRAREAQQALLALDIDWQHAVTRRWTAAAWRLAGPVVEAWEARAPEVPHAS